MTLTTKLSETTVKAMNGETGEIVGYASTFGNIDSYGDSIAAGAFTATLKKHTADATHIPLLFEHDRALDSHVGVITDAKQDDIGLFITAKLDMDTEAGKRAFTLAKGRRITGMSIGFIPTDVEPGNVDGKSATVIKGIDLKEVSLVLNPADSKALVTSVKSAAPEQGSALPRHITNELVKSYESGDMLKDDDVLTKHGPDAMKLRTEYAHLIKSGRTVNAGNVAKLNHDLAADVAQELIDNTLAEIKTSPRGATAKQIEILEAGKAQLEFQEKAKRASRIFAQFTYDTPSSEPGPNYIPQENTHMTTATKSLALTAEARRNIATKAAEKVTTFHTKEALNTGGAFDVPTIVEPNIVGREAPAASILEVIDTQVTTSPTFAYVKQTARDNNAAVVPVGEVKPKSEYGFTRVDESLDVVAHIASGIDQYMLTDTAALSSFLQAEMINGVYDKVEHLVAEAIAGAEGALAQPYEGDLLTTTRAALTTFQTAGLTPAAFMLNPQDWEDIELSKTEGSGAFIFGATPVDQIERTLWSVPVVISHRVAAGAGHVLAADSVRLYHDGTLGLAWDASGELFERNQIAIRAEGRFKPVVLRDTGVINLATAAA